MPRYKVLELSYINGKLVHPGDEVEYDGEASGNLELIDEPKPVSKNPSSPPPDSGGGSDSDTATHRVRK